MAGELLEQAQRPIDGRERGSLGGGHGREDSAFRQAAPVYHPGTWRPGHAPASRRPATSAARRCASRTTPCCAARGGSSTTSTRCPNTGVAAVVRSPFAHARIGAIDASAALALPGVIGVVTGADDRRALAAVRLRARPRRRSTTQPPSDVARYVGEPVCVVVARDRYIAEDAAERVLVDYEPLPVAASVEAALAEGAPLLHPALGTQRRQRPVVQLRRPGRRVRGRRARRARALPPSALVGHAGRVLRRDRPLAGGGVTAWANFQGPFTLHGVAAAALGIPGAKLRLLTPSESGGSFGTKAAVLHAVVLMAIASRIARRAGALDGGSRRAPALGLDGDRADERGRGGVRRRRPPARPAARPARRGRAPTCARPSRPRSTACTAA